MESFDSLTPVVKAGDPIVPTTRDLEYPATLTLRHPVVAVARRDLNTLRFLGGAAMYEVGPDDRPDVRVRQDRQPSTQWPAVTHAHAATTVRCRSSAAHASGGSRGPDGRDESTASPRPGTLRSDRRGGSFVSTHGAGSAPRWSPCQEGDRTALPRPLSRR
ncbi:hypothetical protein GCM10010254_72580 [Streptomyces chromofuscus]|nr:hypothetical protein GCM10010254_72580 [Streptomyces chromofuscus]